VDTVDRYPFEVATDIAPHAAAGTGGEVGTPGPGRAWRWAGRDRSSVVEILVGASLAAVVAAGGAYLSGRPNSNAVDRWLLNLVHASNTWYLTGITVLRLPVVIVVGSVVLALATVWRDRARAFACLAGPPLALLTGELLVKPAVGRTLGGLLSYPSGSTVGAAALATAAVVASPARWRALTVPLAAIYSLWMTVAVIALRWHFPTDALAGVAYGAGLVLLVDGLAWWGARSWGARPGPARRRPSAAVTDPSPERTE
jgi:hypothetical protein